MSDRPELIAAPRGRRLAIARYGADSGPVWVHHHGTNMSRLEAALFDQMSADAGLQVVGIDRPGAGRSDPDPARTLAGWADDVVAVLDHLHAPTAVMSGFSGGGPHALAVAALAPDRVTGVVLGNPAPPDRADNPTKLKRMAALSRRAPWMLQAMSTVAARAMPPAAFADPARRERLLRRLPAADRAVLADPGVLDVFVAAYTEGRRQPHDPFAEEAHLFLGPRGWGFDPTGIDVPIDLIVAAGDAGEAFCRDLAAAAPQVQLQTIEGGHLAVLAEPVRRGITRRVAELAFGQDPPLDWS